MQNYEIKLMEKVTERVSKYLGKGYIFKSGDSSMGYLSRIDLINPENKSQYLRIILREVYVHSDESIGMSWNEIVNLKFFEIEESIINIRKTFQEESDVISKDKFYLIGNKIITEDLEYAKSCNKKAYERIHLKTSNRFTKDFNPTKKLNIKGYKSLKPQDIEITRTYQNTYSVTNEYKIKNLKNNKTITVRF